MGDFNENIPQQEVQQPIPLMVEQENNLIRDAGLIETFFRQQQRRDMTWLFRNQWTPSSTEQILALADIQEVLELTALSRYNRLKVDNYHQLYVACQLGQGTFGDVYLVENYTTIAPNGHVSQPLIPQAACKKIRVDTADRVQSLSREVQALAELGPDAAPALFALARDPTHALIFMEVCPMTWREFIRDQRGIPLRIAQWVRMTYDLLTAVDWLLSRKYTHNDIKPENIVLGRDGKSKLIDFGAAQKRPTEEQFIFSLIGRTIPYLPPELCGLAEGVGFNPLGDVFSAGLSCLFLLLQCDPHHVYQQHGYPEDMGTWGVLQQAWICQYAINVLHIELNNIFLGVILPSFRTPVFRVPWTEVRYEHLTILKDMFNPIILPGHDGESRQSARFILDNSVPFREEAARRGAVQPAWNPAVVPHNIPAPVQHMDEDIVDAAQDPNQQPIAAQGQPLLASGIPDLEVFEEVEEDGWEEFVPVDAPQLNANLVVEMPHLFHELLAGRQLGPQLPHQVHQGMELPAANHREGQVRQELGHPAANHREGQVHQELGHPAANHREGQVHQGMDLPAANHRLGQVHQGMELPAANQREGQVHQELDDPAANHREVQGAAAQGLAEEENQHQHRGVQYESRHTGVLYEAIVTAGDPQGPMPQQDGHAGGDKVGIEQAITEPSSSPGAHGGTSEQKTSQASSSSRTEAGEHVPGTSQPRLEVRKTSMVTCSVASGNDKTQETRRTKSDSGPVSHDSGIFSGKHFSIEQQP